MQCRRSGYQSPGFRITRHSSKALVNEISFSKVRVPIVYNKKWSLRPRKKSSPSPNQGQIEYKLDGQINGVEGLYRGKALGTSLAAMVLPAAVGVIRHARSGIICWPVATRNHPS